MSEQTREQGLGLALTERKGEVAIAAMAAKAKAEVEAKYVIAYNRPRIILNARTAILDACQRPRFAEAARYKKPVGKKQINGRWEQTYIEGFSIRFAEVAIQAMKNITVESSTVWEDDEKRTVHVSVTDLESNLSYGEDITISKTVERKKLKDGQEALATRRNSYGDEVFVVEATEDEIANKVAAQRSKVIRNCGLRLVPQDFLEEAEDAILNTLEKGGVDPRAELKKVADAFNGIGVKPGELEKYLGHSLDTISKKELTDLRAVYSAIKDGEASWNDYLGDASVPKAEATAAPQPIQQLRTKPAAAVKQAAHTPPEDPRDKLDMSAPGNEKIIELPPQEPVTENPQITAAEIPAPPAAAKTPAPATSPSTAPVGASTAPAVKKADAEVPPSKLPADWLPYIGLDSLLKVMDSMRDWMKIEGITEEEVLKWAQGRGLAKPGQKLSDLAGAKLVGMVKQRNTIRVDIIKAR